MKKKLALFIFLTFILLLAAAVISSYVFLKDLSIRTNTKILYFPKLLLEVIKSPTLKSEFNFVLLGLDPRNDLIEQSETTDTIIVGNYGHNNVFTLISIPRDLWDYKYNAKINQIYPIALKEVDKFSFIQDNISRISGQNISRTIIFTTRNLIDLVDLIGGVDVNLDIGFTDSQYPNPDYIKNPSPNIPKYITVEFKKGVNRLDISNITEFVRSRKSADTAENGGTDIGRIKRQQLLIDAIVSKIKLSKTYKNYSLLIKLYNYFHNHISSNFTDQDIASFIINNYQNFNDLTINRSIIPSGNNPNLDIIYYPGKLYNGQWVFLPQNPDYHSLHDFIKLTIYGKYSSFTKQN